MRTKDRLSIYNGKKKKTVGNDLKEVLSNNIGHHGIDEQEMSIHADFDIAENVETTYYNWINDEKYIKTFVWIITDFPVELTSEIFILTTHLNKLYSTGRLVIDTKLRAVAFYVEERLICALVTKDFLKQQISYHFWSSQDIYWAYNRLLNSEDEPAIIFADLLKKLEQERTKS